MGSKPEPGGGRAERSWRVGDLARASGLTVRALHHYDHIGLLTPSGRTSAGHRAYSDGDLARLYRISLLRRLGFPLGQMAAGLDQRQPPAAEHLLAALEEMTMLDGTLHSTTSLLVYDDLVAAHEYLVRVYGLEPGPVTRDAGQRVIHAEVRAGSQVIWLHPAGPGYASPASLGAVTGMTVVSVDDADAHHVRALRACADIIEEPAYQPYGVREYGARDLEGHLWYFHSALGG